MFQLINNKSKHINRKLTVPPKIAVSISVLEMAFDSVLAALAVDPAVDLFPAGRFSATAHSYKHLFSVIRSLTTYLPLQKLLLTAQHIGGSYRPGMCCWEALRLQLQPLALHRPVLRCWRKIARMHNINTNVLSSKIALHYIQIRIGKHPLTVPKL